jgi:hypothetical protein
MGISIQMQYTARVIVIALRQQRPPAIDASDDFRLGVAASKWIVLVLGLSVIVTV